MLDVHHKGRAPCPRVAGEDGGRRGQAAGRRPLGHDAAREAADRRFRSIVNASKQAGRGAKSGSWPAGGAGGRGAARPRRPGPPPARGRADDIPPTSWPCSPACAPARPRRPTTAAGAGCCPTSPPRTRDLAAGLRVLHEPALIAAKDAAAVGCSTRCPGRWRVGARPGRSRRLADGAERRPARPGHSRWSHRGRMPDGAAARTDPAAPPPAASTAGCPPSRTRWSTAMLD